MNKIFKSKEVVIDISVEGRQVTHDTSIFFSYDVKVAKNLVRFKLDGETLSLEHASDIKFVFEFRDTENIVMLDLKSDRVAIEDAEQGLVSLLVPNYLYQFEGDVLIYVYIDFENGQSLDAGIVRTRFEKSFIDRDLKELKPYYIERFEDLARMIKERADELESRLAKTEERLQDIQENIEDFRGPQGIQGSRGETGLPGPQGLQGERGLQGARGEAGPIGPQGLRGEVGAQGERGLTGATGAQGIQGLVGPPGAQGLTGERGPAGIIHRGEWYSGMAVQPNDVVTHNGSAWRARVASSGGTRPDAGNTTAESRWELFVSRGELGPIGPQGPTATNITGNAATATRLQNSRQIGLSGVTATAQLFDGTANVTIPVTEISVRLLRGLTNNTATDWNNVVDTGFFSGDALPNQPPAFGESATRWFVNNAVHNANDTVQIALDALGRAFYVRSRRTQVWQPWNRIPFASEIPALSTTVPAALGTAAIGNATTLARANHVHPMPTAVQIGATPAVHTTEFPLHNRPSFRIRETWNFDVSQFNSTLQVGEIITISSANGAYNQPWANSTAGYIQRLTSSVDHYLVVAVRANSSNTQLDRVAYRYHAGSAGWTAWEYTNRADSIRSGVFDIARIPTGTTATTVALGNHNHTAAQVGAAAVTHNHNADNINAGTLALARIPTGTGATQVALGNHTHGAAATQAVANNLTTSAAGSVLDARQGRELNTRITDTTGTGFVRVNDNTWFHAYPDGKLECYMRVPFSGVAINTAWGNGFHSAGITIPNYPRAFVGLPTVQASLESINAGAMLSPLSNSLGTSTRAPVQTLVRFTTAASANGIISISAFGRWF